MAVQPPEAPLVKVVPAGSRVDDEALTKVTPLYDVRIHCDIFVDPPPGCTIIASALIILSPAVLTAMPAHPFLLF